MAHDALTVAADVFEKAAEYIEAVEKENKTLKEAQQKEQDTRTDHEAEKLAKALKRATGEEVDLTVAKKIAASEDKDVRELINKLASVEEVSALGSARRRQGSLSKTASHDNDADAEFAAWILNG